MKKKIALVLISSGIIFASAFGATYADWAVTDRAEPFGIKVSPYIDKGTKNIYLDTGGTSLWDQAGAWFDAHCWMGVEESADYTMTKVEGTSIYKATINANYQKLVFARVEPGKELDADWTYVWNKTEDLDIPADKEIYTITGWGSDTNVCPGQWEASAHTCTAGAVVKEHVVAHTCTEDGGYDDVTYCIYCNKELSRTHHVDPAAHDELTPVAKVDETCTTTGTLAHYHCEICDELFLDAEAKNQVDAEDLIIPAKGHSPSSEWHCDENNHFHICSDCGEHVDVAAHVIGAPATEEHGAICSICGLEYTEPLGHTHVYEHHNAVNATCETAGNAEYYTCTCGRIFDSTKVEIAEIPVIPALGHTYVHHNAVSPKCETAGNSAYYTCSVCNKIFNASKVEIAEIPVIPATGHTYVHHDAVAATCTKGGNDEYYTCSDCNKIFNASKVEIGSIPTTAALGHSYDSSTHYCTRCNELDPNYALITFKSPSDAGYGYGFAVCGTFTSWGDHPLVMSQVSGGWSVSIVLPKNTTIEYKLVKVSYGTTNIVEWASWNNITHTITDSTTLNMNW